MRIITPQIIDLPKIEDPRGNLTFIEEKNHVLFEIKRVYWARMENYEEKHGRENMLWQNTIIVL